MRKQFVKTVEKVLKDNDRTILLLGDIGVYGFRNAFKDFPNRVYNIGILEQSMVGLASGLSLSGMIPIVHTIAPFMIERAYEQLKLDFGYQKIGGNFISVGASNDYSALGATHQCPADINVLKQIPNMEIVLAGNSEEFDKLFNQSYNNGNPTYFRLSEYENKYKIDVEFGKANVIKTGNLATIIVVGNMLDSVLKATEEMDVTIIYYTTLSPFDENTLYAYYNKRIILCEPYYSGALTNNLINTFKGRPIAIEHIGVPLKFIDCYGTYEETNEYLGLSVDNIKNKIKGFII